MLIKHRAITFLFFLTTIVTIFYLNNFYLYIILALQLIIIMIHIGVKNQILLNPVSYSFDIYDKNYDKNKEVYIYSTINSKNIAKVFTSFEIIYANYKSPISPINNVNQVNDIKKQINENEKQNNKKNKNKLQTKNIEVSNTVPKKNVSSRSNKALFDSITGLPNKSYVSDYFSINIFPQIINGIEGAVITIDVDNFKIINTSYGYEFGDILLQKVAKRLSIFSNEYTLISKLDSDEFLIVLQNSNEHNTKCFMENILEKFEKPFIIDNEKIHLTIRAGIALFSKHGNNLQELIRNSETALYKISKKGKNRYVLFEYSMLKDMKEKMELYNYMRKALERNEFSLYYQPLINVSKNKICGFEALIRWNHPKLGYVPPSRFIPVAEEMGLIVELGQWILKNACKFAKKINEQFSTIIPVSINVSTIQLTDTKFIDSVINIIKETNISPQCICIEITESAFMESMETNISKLDELNKIGIKVSLDDFGTGYSSLNYLRKLPIDTLKIDKSFIDDIGKSNKDITQSIIHIAHKLNVNVVAEGVESKEQYELLNLYKCDMIQGYFFSKPLREIEVPRFLNRNYL